MQARKVQQAQHLVSASYSESNLPLWVKVHELSRLTLIHVRQHKSQSEVLLNLLKRRFYKVLFGGSHKLSGGVSNWCDFEGDNEHFQSHVESEIETSEKCSMEQIQWKKNQKQTISAVIEQIVTMLIRKHQPIVTHHHSPFSDKTNQQHKLSLKHSNHTQTSTPELHPPIDEHIYLATQENCQNEQIHYCSKGTSREDTISSQQKHGLQKILELLKAQRQNNCKLKEKKQSCSQKLWETYGFLMHLDKQKFQEDYVFEKREFVREKILKQLTSKNSINQKIIKRFQKKIYLESSQKKIMKQKSLYSMKVPKQQEETTRKEVSLDKGESPWWGLTLSKGGDLKKTSKKVYTIRSKPKQTPSSLSSTLEMNSQELKQEQIKSKVESSFRQVRKYQSLGRNILNNIVFDPDNMLATSKRKWMLAKGNERNGMRRFEKAIQNNRLLLRVGGIRLSLQECNFKNKLAIENA